MKILLFLLAVSAVAVCGQSPPADAAPPASTNRWFAIPQRTHGVHSVAPRATRVFAPADTAAPAITSALANPDGSVTLIFTASSDTVAFLVRRANKRESRTFCVNPMLLSRSTVAGSATSTFTWIDTTPRATPSVDFFYRVKSKLATHDSAWSPSLGVTAPLNVHIIEPQSLP